MWLFQIFLSLVSKPMPHIFVLCYSSIPLYDSIPNSIPVIYCDKPNCSKLSYLNQKQIFFFFFNLTNLLLGRTQWGEFVSAIYEMARLTANGGGPEQLGASWEFLSSCGLKASPWGLSTCSFYPALHSHLTPSMAIEDPKNKYFKGPSRMLLSPFKKYPLWHKAQH